MNGFIEAAKRHALIKQIKDIYYSYCDCRNRIVCHDPNTIKSDLVRRGFIENYTIWDHHSERRTEASNQKGDCTKSNGDDDTHLFMTHNGT